MASETARRIRRDVRSLHLKTDAILTGIRSRPGMGAVAAPSAVPQGSSDDKKFETGGFRSLGHFARVLRRGTDQGNPIAEDLARLGEWGSLAGRVTRAQPSGLNEASDAEGGLLIPPAFSATIWRKSLEYGNLADRVRMFPISGNTLTILADAETSRADGQRRGGVASYWGSEAGQYGRSRPTFRNVEFKLKKLTVLVYATEELFEDTAGAFDAYMDDTAAEELAFRASDAVVNGSGAGIPLGLLRSSAKVVAPAVAGQGAGTIVANNVDAMWARRHAPNSRRYVWLYNQEIEESLERMYYSGGTSTGQQVYLQEGASGLPYPTLKGREMVNVEQCPALGSEGDLILWDPSQSVGACKVTGVSRAVSMHLRFDYNELALRFTLRMDVQSAWESPIAPFKGAAARSPIVTLSAARA